MPAWNEDDVRHILNRAGFGAEPRDVKKYLKYGHATTVDKLVNAHPSSAHGPGKADADPGDLASLRQWWIKRMLKAKSNRLVEKMCLFWHDHFASTISNVNNNLWMANQNKLFRLWGLGSFHKLVFEVTRDPAMLEFLDGRRNTKTKPNENYGREVMELFVLGVSDLNGADNYTQTDVTQIARALTGWTIDKTNNVGVFDSTRWDTGNKTLFAGKPFQASGALGVVDATGFELPAATNVIDILLNHRDTDNELTSARYIARKLWEYLAYPGPSKALVDEIAAPYAAGGFVIRDLLSAIFLHEEFYSETAKTSSVKNPCEYAFSAIRATRTSTNAIGIDDQLDAMGMHLFDPPGVNGWNNGLAWVSSGQFLARLQFAQSLAAGRDANFKFRPSRLLDLTVTTAAELIDQVLAALGIAGRVPAGSRQAMIDYMGAATDFEDPTVLETKVRSAVYLALALPEANTH